MLRLSFSLARKPGPRPREGWWGLVGGATCWKVLGAAVGVNMDRMHVAHVVILAQVACL